MFKMAIHPPELLIKKFFIRYFLWLWLKQNNCHKTLMLTFNKTQLYTIYIYIYMPYVFISGRRKRDNPYS